MSTKEEEILIQTLQQKDAMFKDQNNKEWLAKHDIEGLKQWLALLTVLNLGQSPALPRGNASDERQPVVQKKPVTIEIGFNKNVDDQTKDGGRRDCDMQPGKEKVFMSSFMRMVKDNNFVLGKDITVTVKPGHIGIDGHTPEARAAIIKFADEMIAKGVLKPSAKQLRRDEAAKESASIAPSPLRTTTPTLDRK